jgi:hypothetical protein
VKVIVVQYPLVVVPAVSDSDVLGGDAGWTTMVADALTLGAFVAEAVAVFLRVNIVPQLELVELLIWTDADAPAAKLPKVQPRTCEPTDPVMMQLPGPPYDGEIDQLIPVPAGKGSLSVTPVAVAVPAADEFDTVMVNPIDVPAETGVASAVFVMDRRGELTVSGSQLPVALR